MGWKRGEILVFKFLSLFLKCSSHVWVLLESNSWISNIWPWRNFNEYNKKKTKGNSLPQLSPPYPVFIPINHYQVSLYSRAISGIGTYVSSYIDKLWVHFISSYFTEKSILISWNKDGKASLLNFMQPIKDNKTFLRKQPKNVSLWPRK